MRSLILIIYFLLACFFITPSFASDVDKIEKKIIMNMLRSVVTQESISIYTDSQRISHILTHNEVRFIDTCAQADVAIIETKQVANCGQVPIITLKYELLKTYPNSIGSFFWQKGRPNIVFIEPRLEKLSIDIGPQFSAFIEESIW